jgi:hypothetical protein
MPSTSPATFSGLRIDYHDEVGAGDVEPVRGSIENQVTPPTCANDIPLILYETHAASGLQRTQRKRVREIELPEQTEQA